MAFDLNGMGEAFAQIERAVPTLADGSGIVVAGVDGVSDPIRIESSWVAPSYPVDARRGRESGRVVLRAVVRSNGSVDRLVVIHCSNPRLGFEQAAKDAVQQ